MKLNAAIQKLSELNLQIEKLSMELETEKIEYNANDLNDKFVYSELIYSILDNLNYASQCLEYLERPVEQEGTLKVKDGLIYMNELKMENGNVVEVLVDDSWVKMDIHKIKDEYYMDLCPAKRLAGQGIKARVRGVC